MSKIIAIALAMFLITIAQPADAQESVDEPADEEEPKDPIKAEKTASESTAQAELHVVEGANGLKVEGRLPGGSTPSSGGSGGSESGLSCDFEPAIENDLAEPVYDYAGAYIGNVDPEALEKVFGPQPIARQYSPTGRWATGICRTADGVTVDVDLYPVGGAPFTLGDLLADALLELDPPIHEVELRPNDKHLVQFPSLFWVDPAYWDADRSTSRTNGNVTLDVALVPFQSEWEPGDGSDTVVCDGPGEVWEWDVDPEDHSCKHVYKSVVNQPFSLTSTVLFEVQTSTNSNEVLGPFDPLPRVATDEVEVREIQVVETSG